MLFNQEKETKISSPRQCMDFPVYRQSGLGRDELSTRSDYELWEAFKRRNEAAFITIYTKYYKALFHHGFKFVKDRELVRDCLQDFFIYLWKNGVRFSPTNSIKPYLLKSFGRRVVEYMNKQRVYYSLQEPCDYIHLAVEPCVVSKLVRKQVEDIQWAKLNRAPTTLGKMERMMYRSIRKLRFFFKNEKFGSNRMN